MNIEVARREFSSKYYYWSLKDFEREIDEGLPFLRELKDSSPYWVVQMISTMSFSEQRSFAKALVKRFHKEALGFRGEVITRAEKELVDRYCERALQLTPSALLFRQRQLAAEPMEHISSRALKRKVSLELETLGLKLLENAGGIWRYITSFGEWDVITEIDTTNRGADLIYHHHIVLAGAHETVVLPHGERLERRIPLQQFISLNAWLGISSTTEWPDLTDVEGAGAAKHLARLCSHFLRAAPELLRL